MEVNKRKRTTTEDFTLDNKKTMKCHQINEGEDTVEHYFKEHPEIEVGECIEYITNNQLGYKKYEVILDEDSGEKTLEIIERGDDFYGGRRRSRKGGRSRSRKGGRSRGRSRKGGRRSRKGGRRH